MLLFSKSRVLYWVILLCWFVIMDKVEDYISDGDVESENAGDSAGHQTGSTSKVPAATEDNSQP